MSATRVLVLGVLHNFGRSMTGYEIRHEIETWTADQWAGIAYSSIYFSLAKMAEEGFVRPVDEQQAGRRPARTVYTITDAGRAEFLRLLRDYWWEIKPATDPFQIALAFMDDIPREELLAALRRRAGLLRARVDGWEYEARVKMSDSPGTPRHVIENMRLMMSHLETELRWIEDTIPKVERGDLP